MRDKRRILTGIRPTGPLHLGHYVGALTQWIELQDDYECFFLIADIQALTTHEEKPELIRQSVREVVLDWLAVGLDPTKPDVHFVLQSAIPELTELTTYLSMVTPFIWIQRNPTIKTELAQLGEKVSAGFMNYPVSQAADILFVSPQPGEGSSNILVPVGEDQIPHLIGTSRIAKAFNRIYGPTFVVCTPKVGDVGRLLGVDGQTKMSKSLENAIYLGDSSERVRELVTKMYTDPTRGKATTPGDPDKKENVVFRYHDAFNSDRAQVEELKARYRTGTVGDVEVKAMLYVALEAFLTPIRQKREEAAEQDVVEILRSGTERARELACETIERVRTNMHLVRI